MFNQLFLGEIKKIFRPKSIIALVLLFLVFFTLQAIGYEETRKFMEELEDQQIERPPLQNPDHPDIGAAIDGMVEYTPENIDEYISLAKAQLKSAQEQKQSEYFYRMSSDPVYQAKTMVAVFEYIKEKKIYNRKIPIYNGCLYNDITTQHFALNFLGIFFMVIMIYGVAIGAGSYAKELQAGSLKMVLMRPITRNKLTTAKILALFVCVASVVAGASLVAFLYGLRYPLGGTQKLLIVFNASTVFIGTNTLMLFLNALFSLIRLFASVLFAFTLGTVTKSRVFGIMVGVLVGLGALAPLLELLGIGRFLFTTNIDFSVFFGISYGVKPGGSFLLSLGMFVAYISAFLAASYIVFDKRDIA